MFKSPFVIYADFECILKPVVEGRGVGTESYTDGFQQHEPCGFCYYVVAADGTQFEPVVYRALTPEDRPKLVDEFITRLRDTEDQLTQLIKQNVKMVLTEEDEADFAAAVDCSMCGGVLGEDRVRDHDHMTGKYRGAAHSKCNIEEGKKRTKNITFPVFFHNLKGYDGHLILSHVGKHTSKLSGIPLNYEKMMSFSFRKLRFLDSAGFLASSLEKLTQNLLEGGKGKSKFVHTLGHSALQPPSPDQCKLPTAEKTAEESAEKLELLLRKGVYPYDYMSSWERFEEAELPPIECFYSQLNEDGISVEDYEHAQEVWSVFGCKNLGDYHDLYVESDVRCCWQTSSKRTAPSAWTPTSWTPPTTTPRRTLRGTRC